MLEIRSIRINIDGLCETFIRTLDIQTNDNKTKIPLANIRARIRMIILYYYANLNNYLVAGTSDRSETLIGFFTKHGDGAADFFPIRHLYKTQVRELTKYLGIPERMATKPSSPQLYPGHKLADELPYDYDKLDPILIGLFDLHMPPEKVSRMTNVPFDLIKEVITRYNKTEHKRKASPTIEVTMKNKLRYSRRMFEPC